MFLSNNIISSTVVFRASASFRFNGEAARYSLLWIITLPGSILVYIAGFIAATALEYVTGAVMERLFMLTGITVIRNST